MTPGTMLAARYELMRPLGRGGMGQVWLALDHVLGREVAVKTIDLAATGDPSAAARFEREGRAAAALVHEHVVTVFDSGTEGSCAFLVMQLLPGPSVAELLHTGEALSLERAVEIAEQTAAALAAIHGIGIVHRDIKPANLVFDSSGRLKVVDFGIASIDGTSGQLTAASTIVGSAAYMAPEQADGGRATPATDLYALGCVMMTLLTGQPPFAGEHPLALLQQHVHAPAPRLSERLAGVPHELDALVARLLAKAPEERGDGAARVREELAAIRSSLPAATLGAVPLGAAVPLEAAAPVAGAETTRLLDPAGDTTALEASPRSRRSARTRALLAVGALVALAALLLVLLPLLQRPGTEGALASQAPTAEDPAAVTPPPGQSADPAESAAPQLQEPATGAVADPAPEGAAPAAAPGEPAPEQPAPEQPAPEEPAPEQPAPEQPAPEEPAPVEPAPEEPVPAADFAGVRDAIAGAIASGGLEADAGQDLLGRIADLEARVAEGKTEDLPAKLRELSRRVDELQRDGAVSPEAAASIKAAIAAVA